MSENLMDRRTDAVVIGILIAHPGAFGSGELITPKNSPDLWWAKTNIHNFILHQNINFSKKNPKNIEIQKCEPPKMVRAYIYVKV